MNRTAEEWTEIIRRSGRILDLTTRLLSMLSGEIYDDLLEARNCLNRIDQAIKKERSRSALSGEIPD